MADIRENLIELITGFYGVDPMYYGVETQPLVDHLIANGVTLDNQVSSSKWISVKDRLPEKITNKVIVLCKNGYRGFGHYENYKGKQTWYNLESDKPFTDWDLEDCESYEVTHWMPLPQPPKGE